MQTFYNSEQIHRDVCKILLSRTNFSPSRNVRIHNTETSSHALSMDHPCDANFSALRHSEGILLYHLDL
jgi:hypothetical protein